MSRKKNFPESHVISPLLTKLVRSRWLDIGLGFFCFGFFGFFCASINTQKKNLTNIQPTRPHTWSITHIYYMALTCGRYNARSHWLGARSERSLCSRNAHGPITLHMNGFELILVLTEVKGNSQMAYSQVLVLVRVREGWPFAFQIKCPTKTSRFFNIAAKLSRLQEKISH